MVNTANDGNALEVTEIEAYDVTTQPSYTTTEDVTTTETILANLAFRPFDWLSFTYDLNQDHRKNKETGADTTTTRTETRRSWHDITGLLGKGFQVHKYLEVLPQYERRLEYEDDSQTEPRTDISRSIDTFRVRFVSSPLETLDTDLSLNHWVLQEESKTESRTSSALLHIAAELREGADLDIDGDITRSENLLTKSFEKRSYIPGQHGVTQRTKLSEYGIQLREKQKVKRIYGVYEAQFRNYYNKATRQKGVSGENLLRMDTD